MLMAFILESKSKTPKNLLFIRIVMNKKPLDFLDLHSKMKPSHSFGEITYITKFFCLASLICFVNQPQWPNLHISSSDTSQMPKTYILVVHV